MIRFLLLSILSSLSLAHAETKLSVLGSLIYSNPDTNNLNGPNITDEKSGTGFGIGMRALLGLKDQLHFRSGASLVQKRFAYESTALAQKTNHDFNLIYLNLPLTLYWKASSQVGFFGGTALNAKLSDDCQTSGAGNSCTQNKVRAVVFPAIVGFDFSFTEKIGLELSYEYGMTETAKDLKVHSAIASFLFHLD